MIKIGDIFEIQLDEGRKAYGQYIFKDKEQGPLIQVFDLIVDESSQFNISDIESAKLLFPPVITGLFAAIRTGLWKIVGTLPVAEFDYPIFISSYYDENTGEAYRWFKWDGQNYYELGNKLPKEYKRYEYLVVWSPYDIIFRIQTGKYPFPYGDLIKKNKFVPKSER